MANACLEYLHTQPKYTFKEGKQYQIKCVFFCFKCSLQSWCYDWVFTRLEARVLNTRVQPLRQNVCV